MAAIGAILGGVLLGAAVSAATSTIVAIQQVRQAETTASYRRAVAQAQADYTKSVVKVEAEEKARAAKFTFASQRATGAAMGLGFPGTSVEEIQQMDIGLATLDIQQKLYEGDVAQWQADVTKQMADYEADVAKYNAWSGVGLSTLVGGITGGVGAGVGAATAATGVSFGFASGALEGAKAGLGASGIVRRSTATGLGY